MGQQDVLLALVDLRKINDDWFSSKQIIEFMLSNKSLDNKGKNVYDDLLRLAAFNLIEVRGVGMWNHHKEFRGKQ